MADTIPRTNAVAKMCSTKRQYRTESEALGVAARRLADKRGPIQLRVYQCRICNYYHLTSKEYNYGEIHSQSGSSKSPSNKTS